MNGPTRTLALFPGGLGDFLCAWAALDALRADTGTRLTLVAREAWFDTLPAGIVTPVSIERREVADLFAAGPIKEDTRRLFSGFARAVSWTGHSDANFSHRLSRVTGIRAAVHPFRGMMPGEHAAAYFGRCLGVIARFRPLCAKALAARWADAFWRAHGLGPDTLVIHPGSGAPGKNWEGMSAVADAWRRVGGRVILVCGPAELDRGNVSHDVAVHNERLDRLLALLRLAPRYLGNDSGVSHLAGYAETPGLALFGSTDPCTWRPLGASIRILHAPAPCAQCGPARFCVHRISVPDVLTSLRSLPPECCDREA
jgi:Glycosyltransferase family 9 (heptosyltransferase)